MYEYRLAIDKQSISNRCFVFMNTKFFQVFMSTTLYHRYCHTILGPIPSSALATPKVEGRILY